MGKAGSFRPLPGLDTDSVSSEEEDVESELSDDEDADELELVLDADELDDDEEEDGAGLGIFTGNEMGVMVERAGRPSSAILFFFSRPLSPEVALLRTPKSCFELPARSRTLFGVSSEHRSQPPNTYVTTSVLSMMSTALPAKSSNPSTSSSKSFGEVVKASTFDKD